MKEETISTLFITYIKNQLHARAASDSGDLATRLKITIFTEYLECELLSRLSTSTKNGEELCGIMMSTCMVVAANHRTSFELLLGSKEYVITNVFGTPSSSPQQLLCFTTLNGWLKQEGSKVLKRFIVEQTNENGESTATSTSSLLAPELLKLQEELWKYLATHVRSYQAPQGGDKDNATKEEVAIGGGTLVELPGYPNVAIHECSAAPVVSKTTKEEGSDEEDDEVAVKEGWLTLSEALRGDGTTTLKPFSELLRIPGTEIFHMGTANRYSRWMRLLSGGTKDDHQKSTNPTSPSSSSSPTSQYPKVQRAISDCISDDESRLLLSFVFEGKREAAVRKVLASTQLLPTPTSSFTTPTSSSRCCVGDDDVGHFSFLLSRIPLRYPTVPTHWSPMDYMMLTGTDLAEVVPQKKEQLTSFVTGVQAALFAALRIPNLPSQYSSSEEEGSSPICHLDSPLHELHVDILRYLLPEWTTTTDGDATISTTTTTSATVFNTLLAENPTTLLAVFLTELFSEAHVQWARATFDSRAFNLNFNGEVRLVLAPVIDMVNHNGDRSDILVRRIDPINQDFVIENGAALPPSSNSNHNNNTSTPSSSLPPQELLMSYGPLQNWELLLSYGFAFDPLVAHPTTTTIGSRMDEKDIRMEGEVRRDVQETLLRKALYMGNAYDRVPLPLDLSGEDDATDEESKEFVLRRQAIIEKACLRVGQGIWVGPPVNMNTLSSETQTWLSQQQRQSAVDKTIATTNSVVESIPSIPPYPAVLAALRLTHSQIEEFPSLESNPFAPVSSETEATMVATLKAILQSIILSFYNPSLDETVGLLLAHNEKMNSDYNTAPPPTTDEEEEEEEEEELTTNEALSYFVNLPLLAMAHGCLKWCCEQEGEDFAVTVQATLNHLNYEGEEEEEEES